MSLNGEEFWKVQWISRKWICNAELCLNYFSVNASVLALIFRRQIFKKATILPEIVGFFKLVGEIQQLLRKRSQKIHYDVNLHYILLSIYPLHFPKFCKTFM